MRIDAITVGTRHRTDMGDLDGLARSIGAVGLLHPVVVTPAGELIAGRRRLAACERLGWEEVPVTVVALDEVIRGEWAENSERKDFTPSEAAAVGRALEEIVREQAREREYAGQPSGNLPEGSKGRTRDIVGRAVGMSGSRYERVKAVVAAAEADPERFGPVLEEMDRTGKVEPAYARTKRHRTAEAVPAPRGPLKSRATVAWRRARIVEMAKNGYREESIAEEVGVGVHTVRAHLHGVGVPTIEQKTGKRSVRLDADRIMEGLVEAAAPSEPAVKALDWGALDRSRLMVWDERLSAAIRALTQLRNRLREEIGT